MKSSAILLQSLIIFCILLVHPVISPFGAGAQYPFGQLLMGPANDHGWSRAHFESAQASEKNFPVPKRSL